MRHWALAVLILGAPLSRLATADVRALVVGIDAYQHITTLEGAVADARDVARALREIGAKDLTIRLNQDATRERLESDWKEMVAHANPGDTLVLTFAGHGSQEPERVPGSEEDGKDEVLLLGGFAPFGPGTRERLVDDELNQWFTSASEKDVDILFVADACHSGTLTRGVDLRAGPQRYRFVSYAPITDDMLELDIPPAVSESKTGDLPNLTFLAAGQESQTVPEVSLFNADWERAPRGALSWTFARALEGPADANSDGRLTRNEINHFVRANVRALVEARQTPNLLPDDGGDQVVLPTIPPEKQAKLVPTEWPVIHVRLIGHHRGAFDPRPGVVISDDEKASADVVFDLTKEQAVSGHGDIVARNLSQEKVDAVIDKWRSLERLNLERLGDRLTMRILPDDGTHHEGQTVAFEIDDIKLPYLVFFSLSGDGTVHYHYPLPGDPDTVALGEPVAVQFRVTPPFGADHIIAVTSDKPLEGLAHRLAALDGSRSARRAAEAVLGVTRQGQRQLGIQGLYTAP